MSTVEVDWNECILWDGPLKGGYAYRRRNGKEERMSRVIMEEKIGKPIPPGLIVRHKCDTPACVTPDHLLLGTRADNVADMDRRGRRVLSGVGLISSTKTHCLQGHSFNKANTELKRDGSRRCKTCRRASDKKHYEQNSDKVLARQKAYRARDRVKV